ncbi:MAG: low molecular weight phosphatase family protein, partial [Acidimicrobiales bacterium]
PGAVAAARRAGLDLTGAHPRVLEPDDLDVDLVVTVCDRAHEELDPPEAWLHWSVPDPVEAGTRHAFDATLAELDDRVRGLITSLDGPAAM